MDIKARLKRFLATSGILVFSGQTTTAAPTEMYSTVNNFIVNIISIALPVLIAFAFVKMLFKQFKE